MGKKIKKEDFNNEIQKNEQLKPHEKDKIDYSYLLKPQHEEVQDDAPNLIVVQGSRKSGKTTLIQSLIKHFNKHKLNDIHGTVTLRINKSKRITFIECPNNINAMIDLAKVADLALILIDASVGFEMETFEFLSILKAHGFPNVMGILTHMDFFKENKQLKRAKKQFKKRFIFEVGDDYKLFYIQGLKPNGLYANMDIHNLARYITIIKTKHASWKLEHSYFLIDRFQINKEGNINELDEQCDISFYGYVRGCSYRLNNYIHIMGLGDYEIESIKNVVDPCPQLEKFNNINEENKEKSKKQNRTLKETQKIIYAPYCNLDFMHVERHGYITIPDEYVVFTKKQNANILDDSSKINQDIKEVQQEEGVKMIQELQDIKMGLNKVNIEEQQLEIFDKVPISLPNNFQSTQIEQLESKEIQLRRKTGEINALKNRQKQISMLFYEGLQQGYYELGQNVYCKDISEMIYNNHQFEDNRKGIMSILDCSKYSSQSLLQRDEYLFLVKEKFLNGMKVDQESQQLQLSSNQEMLSNQEKQSNQEENDSSDINEEIDKKLEENYQDNQKQKNDKKKFDWLQEPLPQEVKSTDGKAQIYMTNSMGIFRRGSYVEIKVKNIKYRHCQNFSSNYPLILCRINPSEDNLGIIKAKILRHRFYDTILKTNDPLIISCGWRRYQTLPIYAIQDQNDRYRMLKYTPKHEFCYVFFYGNFVAQNTGILCTQTNKNSLMKFRISATGYVCEIDKQYQIMKKLKLVGEPFKIYKNTAFIKGMFNSSLEVAKFLGAKIRTVSGIRGQIKKQIKVGSEGSFRATFEDKIKLSDIIFCRTWYQVKIEKFYNPLITYQEEVLARTQWELRKQNNIPLKLKKDSEYKEIQRQIPKYESLKINPQLSSSLPFKSREKIAKQSLKEKIRLAEEKIPVKILTSDYDKQVFSMIQRLNTIRNEKSKIRKSLKEEKKRIKLCQQKGENKEKEEKKKELKKQKYKSKFQKKNKQNSKEIQ